MTFARTAETIHEGDWVIVYNSRQSLTSETVSTGKEIQSRYGCFRHADMIGKPWGTKLASTNGRGFVFLLKPTPELWTLALPHRTQILYLPDIAFITSYLNVKPGSQIIEAGTGSGSFSHSLARTVGKSGKVHSFEYHEERFAKAREEFEQHGLEDVITVKHQNVYKDGFDGLENEIDSVFLDLPAPWDALQHAKRAMRKDCQARICCFSPCIEQVIRTCSALAELGFSDITMYECLTRTHDPSQVVAPPISTAIDRIKEVEVKKERRREGQIEDARKKREEKKRKAEEEAAAAGEAPEDDTPIAPGEAEDVGDEAEGAPPAKRQKVDEDAAVKMDEDAPFPAAPSANSLAIPSTVSPSASSAAPPALSVSSETPSRADTPTAPSRNAAHKVFAGAISKEDREFSAKVGPYSRGHTSFLTFAVLLPEVDAEAGHAGSEAEAAKEEKGEAANASAPVDDAAAAVDSLA
ncbi:hypothetical protein JCM10207_006245 [Rhodosporidiobolus poonsookiae]